MVHRIGILTSGGDAAGMNYAVVSVARCASKKHIQLVGIEQGYGGIIGPLTNLNSHSKIIDINMALDMEAMRGTWLRTARCDEFLDPEIRKEAAMNLRDAGIQALVVVGGDGSFKGAQHLTKLGIPCVGIPGTIDNDLGYTEYTLGFNTAVSVCVEAVRAVRATSRSHDRPHVVEVMGRHCGDIATQTAMATGAEILIIPEVRWNIEHVAHQLRKQIRVGNTRATVVIAEHSWENMEDFDWISYLNEQYIAANSPKRVPEGEEFDSHRLAQILSFMTGSSVRSTVVGYTQRGATCSALDGATAFQCGHHAIELLCKADEGNIVSRAIGVKNNRIFDMDFDEALAIKKTPDLEMYELINSL